MNLVPTNESNRLPQEDGLSEGELASRVAVDSETIVAWEEGTEQPTKGQFRDWLRL
jgi:DNA-binding transcriptional regulator YiaG